SGSKLANHLMIDSSTLSLFSFQGTFWLSAQKATSSSYHVRFDFTRGFFDSLCRSAATRTNITNRY
ncbi:hypothetical protein, partial [Brevibacillus choshinensis]|uniref:hypothetical protein n=1 Tax=Brevibacillus choshinensis TaxID=54911 RepID=UPI001F391F80